MTIDSKLVVASIGLAFVLGVAGGYWYSQRTSYEALNTPIQEVAIQLASTTSPIVNSGWKTYVNAQHGYEVSYPANVNFGDVNFGMGGISSPNDPTWNSVSSSTKEWYASACVGIYTTGIWYINISAEGSDVPCGTTGLSSTYQRASDTVEVDQKYIIADGYIEPDRSANLFGFNLYNNIHVEYGIATSTSLSEEDYQAAMYSIHAILSTLKLIPNFIPTHPAYPEGRG